MVIASKQPAYSDREKAYTATQNILQSTPDIKGVFAGNDEEALGALRALQQAGKKVPIIGVDANEDALKSILAGDLFASVAQGNYDMGRLAIEKALELKAGKTIDKRIDSGATMMTKDNAQSLLDFRMSIKWREVRSIPLRRGRSSALPKERWTAPIFRKKRRLRCPRC